MSKSKETIADINEMAEKAARALFRVIDRVLAARGDIFTDAEECKFAVNEMENALRELAKTANLTKEYLVLFDQH